LLLKLTLQALALGFHGRYFDGCNMGIQLRQSGLVSILGPGIGQRLLVGSVLLLESSSVSVVLLH
jgi:hypothetical protein